jgi:hypothetical protein
MALKNQGIASANPSAIANRAYIDALYKEVYGRYATENEYNRFKNNTVKDAANIILGQNLSPFADKSTVATSSQTTSVPTQTQQTSSTQKATLSSPDGRYKTIVSIGSSEASRLQGSGWKVGASGTNIIDTNTALNYKPTTVQSTPTPSSIQPTGQKATLSSPDGKYKIVVTTGSAEASRLQSSGWTVGATGKNILTNINDALSYSGVPVTQENNQTTSYDPYEEALKYGYSREDFANDPGFEAYWSRKTPEQLKAALTSRSDYDKTTGKKKADAGTSTTTTDESGLTSEQKAELDKLNIDIDGMDLSIEEKAILKQIAGMDFTSGNKIPTVSELQTIIDTAAKNAETDLSPYYEKITGRTIEDLSNKMADIRNESARYTQQEALAYKDKLATTKQSLRARGLTFSGSARGTLGAEGAIENAGIEGAIPTERRYNWEDQRAGWQEKARDLGIEAERQLGSATLNEKQDMLGNIINPYKQGITYNASNVSPLYNVNQKGTSGYVATGDIALDRLKEIEKSKWDRVSKYRSNI